ncbi:hypothetical protein A3A64_02475 [Candidatus Gottesmanbacteria bacterium RIFCSPLOWO2_01_FULL_48_11]|uniref:PaaX domain protein n=2 Tax=Candidatus Gottesmaniibacteriota TaxID=1752720 RepID=A0A0G1TZ71_9BACT|nr:MAG: PaaX domain protein [Candidatus Gottesmanbacteria bacterium GW2011_GWA2_47_9]OGG27910.1 MAG: hypothetical protein A3A64_02475 [Candidatus Gottesmanbacteria bacterium RIFCSPLOWO2_01_FULL_48_11]
MQRVKRFPEKKKIQRKKKNNPYANIQWEKTAKLFERQPDKVTKPRAYPRVADILTALMRVGEAGLTVVFESHKRGAEFLHPGLDTDWRFKQIVRQLEKRRFVRMRDNPDGSVTLTIAKRGMIRALTYQLDTMTLSIPRKWDKKWRVIIFDIPVAFNRIRDIFRMRLQQLGLYQLQESVYISPYSCFDEVEFLRELYGVPFTVRYLLVEKVEEDSFLKKHFRLS